MKVTWESYYRDMSPEAISKRVSLAPRMAKMLLEHEFSSYDGYDCAACPECVSKPHAPSCHTGKLCDEIREIIKDG